jgi:hypothetical protein
MTEEFKAPVIPTTLPGIAALILYLSVDCSEISTSGKEYRWPRLRRCPRCGGTRLWGHGYVPRYFGSRAGPLWMKRWRCPECRAVHTARPWQYWRGFIVRASAIHASIVRKLAGKRWMHSFSRQRQQYWYAGFARQQLARPGLSPEELLGGRSIAATHSLTHYEIRLCEDEPHLNLAFTPSARAP